MGTRKTSDQIIDEYLRGGSSLSRDYRALAMEQPRAAVDRNILAQAREAVTGTQSKSKPWFRIAPGPFAAHWALPVSLATVLVVSVTLVLTLSDHGAVPVVSEPAGLETKADGFSVDSLKESPTEPRKFAPARAPEAARTPLPELRQDKALGRSRTESPSDETKSSFKSAVPEERVQVPAAPASIAPSVDDKLERGMRNQSAEKAKSPEAWLVEIRELRRQGRKAEADAALRAFKQRYPDYPLDTLDQAPAEQDLRYK